MNHVRYKTLNMTAVMMPPTHQFELVDNALEALRITTGLTGKVVAREANLGHPKDPVADALIEIEAERRKHRFAVEVKRAARIEVLAQAKARWPKNPRLPLLVVTPYMTAHVAEQCKAFGLFFLDAAGNAYLKDKELFVYITGRKQTQETERRKTTRKNNAAGLKLLFAILCKPDLLNATYREVATAADVALGTVGPVIKDLEQGREVATFGSNPPLRRLTDADHLLQEWVTFYPGTLRPKLNPRRFRAANRDVVERADLTKFEAYWGGEVAADRLTKHLKPERLTIYVCENPVKLITELRLKADKAGDIEILDAFWDPKVIRNSGDVVPPILAYADLMATTDGRNLDAARLIYDQYLAPNFRTLKAAP